MTAFNSKDSKTAEFARLFDLFERLASRKSRAPHGDQYEDIHALPVPPDLAPVVQSLASIVGTRNHLADGRLKNAVGGRARRKTVASADMLTQDSDDDDDVSLAKFPLGKRYPFTFKMMLHKLYQLDDWAEKVKKVLERSQMEYKPLAETGLEVRDDQDEMEIIENPDGRVHFKAGVNNGGGRRPTVRPRCHSVLVLGKGRDIGAGPTSPVKSLKRGSEDTRAIKKRCVGRRKSMSGPISTEVGRIGGGWVYDATVSSFESTERTGAESLGPKSRPRSRYQSLGGQKTVGAGHRRVSLGSPGTSGVQWEQPRLDERRIAVRSRALSVMEGRVLNRVEKR